MVFVFSFLGKEIPFQKRRGVVSLQRYYRPPSLDGLDGVGEDQDHPYDEKDVKNHAYVEENVEKF